MSDIKYEFLMSQLKLLRDIKENDKTKISIVFYEGSQSTCIFRVCKNRDLSSVCSALMDIKHPNIEVVYDYVYSNGNTYIVEEHISGRTLEQIINEEGTFPESKASKVLANVCDSLDVLHKHQPPVVHNDINASNIMIRDDGSVKLFDFDIARTYKEGVGKNTALFGTEEYASPEHFGYGQSEPRTDIYSLGVTLHKMLTGKSLTKEHKMIYEGKLSKVIQKCIQIDPKQRYRSVLQLKKDLEKSFKRTLPVLNKMFAVAFVVMCIIIAGFVIRDLDDEDSSNNSNNLNTDDGSNVDLQEKTNDSTEKDGMYIAGADIGVDIDKATKNQNDKESDQTSDNSTIDDKGNDTENVSENSNTDEEETTLEKTSDNETVGLDDQASEQTTENNSSTQKNEGEEQTTQGNEAVNKVKNVQTIENGIYSMVVKSDGTYIWLTKEAGSINNQYIINTSKGEKCLIKESHGTYCCNLAYNSHTDKLYVIMHKYEDFYSDVYICNKDFSLTKVATFDKIITDRSWKKTKVHFFEDGIMYCDIFEYELIDTTSWSAIGNADVDVDAVINDQMYYIKWSADTYRYSIAKIDSGGKIIKEYLISNNNYSYNIEDNAIYSNGKYLYFVASVLAKEYLYRFDGNSCEIISCLNDYKYYSPVKCGGLNVTDEYMWIYDENTHTIKEFKLK